MDANKIVSKIFEVRNKVMPVFEKSGNWTEEQESWLNTMFDWCGVGYYDGKTLKGEIDGVDIWWQKFDYWMSFVLDGVSVQIYADHTYSSGRIVNESPYEERFVCEFDGFEELLSIRFLDDSPVSIIVERISEE